MIEHRYHKEFTYHRRRSGDVKLDLAHVAMGFMVGSIIIIMTYLLNEIKYFG
jgi:hypothetical protein